MVESNEKLKKVKQNNDLKRNQDRLSFQEQFDNLQKDYDYQEKRLGQAIFKILLLVAENKRLQYSISDKKLII